MLQAPVHRTSRWPECPVSKCADDHASRSGMASRRQGHHGPSCQSDQPRAPNLAGGIRLPFRCEPPVPKCVAAVRSEPCCLLVAIGFGGPAVAGFLPWGCRAPAGGPLVVAFPPPSGSAGVPVFARSLRVAVRVCLGLWVRVGPGALFVDVAAVASEGVGAGGVSVPVARRAWSVPVARRAWSVPVAQIALSGSSRRALSGSSRRALSGSAVVGAGTGSVVGVGWSGSSGGGLEESVLVLGFVVACAVVDVPA